MRCARAPRAFTIVELMVALAGLTFGVYVIYERFQETSRPGRMALQKAQGRWLAEKRLEELRACPAAALRAWPPSERFEPIDENPKFRVKSALAAGEGGSVEITVTVGWEPTDAEGQSFNMKQLVTAKGLRNP